MGKNFGSVLIPDGLLSHLPNMKSLMNELSVVVRSADKAGELRKLQVSASSNWSNFFLQKQLDNIESYDPSSRLDNNQSWTGRITPWSLALFKSLPKFIRRELTQVDMGEVGLVFN